MIDYKALAKRLEMHAECHANVEPFDDEQRQWADDLRTVVSLLRGMADAKPLSEYHEDNGPVLWWAFPINEPPYVGQPSDCDWPGYHTHWTPLVVPVVPHPAPRPKRPYGTDTMSEMGIVPVCDEPERQPVSEPTKAQIEQERSEQKEG